LGNAGLPLGLNRGGVRNDSVAAKRLFKPAHAGAQLRNLLDKTG